jgi:hypothetical protein
MAHSDRDPPPHPVARRCEVVIIAVVVLVLVLVLGAAPFCGFVTRLST